MEGFNSYCIVLNAVAAGRSIFEPTIFTVTLTDDPPTVDVYK